MNAATIDRTRTGTRTEDGARAGAETDVEQFAIETVGDGVAETVVVRGELDIATTPLLTAVLDSVHSRQLDRLEVDLSGVTFLDAHAVAALVAADRHLAERQVTLVLRDPSPIARRVLALTGVDHWLEIL